MPRIAYIEKRFSRKNYQLIDTVNGIIDEYLDAGFDLTLRQLYYQLVARDIIPNSQKEYKRLGDVVSEARLAGHIDWNAIVDRTRNLRGGSHWNEPQSIILSATRSYAIDKWAAQPNRVEVWVEKDALIGVIEHACQPLDVNCFSCRGYTSQSEMWVAAERHIGYESQEAAAYRASPRRS